MRGRAALGGAAWVQPDPRVSPWAVFRRPFRPRHAGPSCAGRCGVGRPGSQGFTLGCVPSALQAEARGADLCWAVRRGLTRIPGFHPGLCCVGPSGRGARGGIGLGIPGFHPGLCCVGPSGRGARGGVGLGIPGFHPGLCCVGPSGRGARGSVGLGIPGFHPGLCCVGPSDRGARGGVGLGIPGFHPGLCCVGPSGRGARGGVGLGIPGFHPGLCAVGPSGRRTRGRAAPGGTGRQDPWVSNARKASQPRRVRDISTVR